MVVYLTDVRGERVVIIQVNWIGEPKQPQKLLVSAAHPSAATCPRPSESIFFKSLFKICYVGRVGLEPTTGGL